MSFKSIVFLLLVVAAVFAWNRKQEEELISHLPFTVPAPILSGIKGYTEFHEEGNYTIFLYKESALDAIMYKGLPPTHVHVLAVGGGGAGGDSLPDDPLGIGGGGGGGGGGCLEETLTISGFDTVTITVGAGGKGIKRTNGADTLLQFQRTPKHNLRAYGGGAGGLTRKGGAKGGSGGGHGRDSGPKKGVIAVNSTQGHAGGSTGCSHWCGGSGGGGAGAPGGSGGNVFFSQPADDAEIVRNAVASDLNTGNLADKDDNELSKGTYTGNGGDGRVCTLPGIHQLFDTVYWAGGGGAASNGRAVYTQHDASLVTTYRCTGDSQSAGVGGKGGGGRGAILSDKEVDSVVRGGDGEVNTGGGGGGGVGTGGTGGDGGSGIVILSTLTHICAPGAFAAESEITHITICTPCPANTYKTLPGSTGRSSCVACLKGTFSVVGSSACRNCASGNEDPNCQGRHLNSIKYTKQHEEL